MAYPGPPRPYSPYQNSQSPSPTTNSPIGGGIHIPPAKKLRLSPNPQSPYVMSGASPTYGGGGLTLPTPAPKPLPQPFNQPQSIYDVQNGDIRPRQGSMGPPPQPVLHDGEEVVKADKVTDVTQLQDVINAAGVDVTAEENYLANTYRNVRNFGYQNESFGTASSMTISPNTSFTQLSQGITGHLSLQGSGPSSQIAQSQEAIERELKRKHESAARTHAEKAQDHLRSSFLLLNVVRHKLRQKAYENGVGIDLTGLFDPIQNLQPTAASPYTPSTSVMGGQNGTGMVSSKSHALLQPSANIADLLSLISLATNERVRGLLEDAYGFSRGRRAGTDGVVPPEWSDLAVGHGEKPATAVPESITNSPWDEPPPSAVSPTSNPLKRKLSDRLPTKSFTSPLPNHLRTLITTERDAEKARLKARKTRPGATAPEAATAAATAAATNLNGAPASPAAGTVAPELQGAVKLSKKEREKAKKADLNEEVMHKNANQAAMSAFGKSFSSKYSWFSGGGGGSGAGSAAGSGTSTPRGGAPAAGGAMGNGAGGVGLKGGPAGGPGAGGGKEKRWGEWREDGQRGAGIQVRDWVQALEKDGKERKALVVALAKMNSRDTNGAERNA